jgi:hypothetical protein
MSDFKACKFSPECWMVREFLTYVRPRANPKDHNLVLSNRTRTQSKYKFLEMMKCQKMILGFLENLVRLRNKM